MQYNFFKTCEFLVADAPVFTTKLHKQALPAVNHTAAVAYAQVLDQCFGFEESKVKPTGFGERKFV